MKGIQYQCLYDIDDKKYVYTAFNHDGTLCGFINPPVRNYALGIWVDSCTGEPGDLFMYEGWETSLREPESMTDMRKPKINYNTTKQFPQRKPRK